GPRRSTLCCFRSAHEHQPGSHQHVGARRATADDACHSGVRRSGRSDVIWTELPRPVAAHRRLGRQDFARREAGRHSRRAADQIRSRHQPDHRQGSRPRHTTEPARARRRGDRMIGRREFITLLGSAAAAWPLAARAQQPPTPMIGFLHPSSAEAYASLMRAFRKGLGQVGYVEGWILIIECRWADDHKDRLPALAAELVGKGVSVIATVNATAAALAAKAATSTIPIVFTIGADPVQFGLVASLNRPGGNVPGGSFLSNLLVAKHLGLLQESVPAASGFGLIVTPSNPNADSDTRQAQAAADSLGREIHVVYASTERDLGTAFAALIERRVAALVVVPDALFVGQRKQLATL